MYYADLFQNKTLDSIYHPSIVKVETIILNVTFIISLPLTVFTIYVVKSQSAYCMRIYKHVLLFEIVGSFIFALMIVLFRPVVLWPMRAAITTGILGGSSYSVFIVFGAGLSAGALLGTGQSIQFVYRVSATFHHTHWMRLMFTKRVSYVYYCYFTMFLVFFCIHLAPVLTNIDNPMKSQALFLADFPPLEPLVSKYPFLTGYHPEVSNFMIDALLYYGMVMISGIPIVFIIAMLFFVWRMQLMETKATPKTYAVHLMLFKALLVQYVFMFIFLAVPLWFFVNCLYFEVIWGSYVATSSLVAISFHIIPCCLSILWFIGPYRSFVKQCLRMRYFKLKARVRNYMSKVAPSG